MRSVVLIPTYNEIDSLPTALDRVRSAAVQLMTTLLTAPGI